MEEVCWWRGEKKFNEVAIRYLDWRHPVISNHTLWSFIADCIGFLRRKSGFRQGLLMLKIDVAFEEKTHIDSSGLEQF
jgi:hypothetical protein